jgi:hypothetical protein
MLNLLYRGLVGNVAFWRTDRTRKRTGCSKAADVVGEVRDEDEASATGFSALWNNHWQV